MMIQSLLSLTETRDPETGQHSRRTQRNMRLLAERLARNPAHRAYLTPNASSCCRRSRLLHDIGKVA